MPMTTIVKLEVNTKNTIRGIVLEKSTRSYSNGTLMKGKVKDESGEIDFVGFNESFEKFYENINVGTTYIFNDVMIQAYGDNKQFKMTSNSGIYVSPSQIKFETMSIIECLTSKVPNESVTVKAVVSYFEDKLSTTSNGGNKRLMKICDSTSSCDVYAINEAANKTFEIGSIVTIVGKVGNSGTNIIVFSPISEANDSTLSDWWDSEGKNVKKFRKEIRNVDIAHIKDCNKGDEIKLNGVIETCAIAPVVITVGESTRTKRVITIADSTNHKIEVSVFGESSVDNFPIGKQVSIIGKMSTWNGVSLTTNVGNITDCENFSVREYDSLSKWWELEGMHLTMVNVSVPEIKSTECTVAEARKMANGSRVTMIGKIIQKDGGDFIADKSESEPLLMEPHTSFTNPPQFEDGQSIVITNARIVVKEETESKLIYFADTPIDVH